MRLKQLHVLILDGDTNAARAVVQSLGRAGHHCWVAAPHARVSAFVSRHARRTLIYPDPLGDRHAFLEWVVMQQRGNEFDHVLAATERSLVPLHEARSALPSGVAILPPPAALETVLDKEALRKTAVALGIPVPESRLLAGASPTLERGASWIREIAHSATPGTWPAVVKPVRSKLWIGPRGSNLHVRLAADADALERHLRYLLPLGDVQVQEWVPGTGVGIEVLARHGEILLEFAHERLHEYPLTGGASTYRRKWTPPSRIREAAARLVAELGWHGVAMVEFRFDSASDRFWLMEVNGRFWGSLPLAIFAGVDFPVALLDMWRGAPPRASAPRRGGASARQFSGELQWVKAVLHPQAGDIPWSPRPSLRRALLEWARVFSGREIWDGASRSDPLPLLHEIATSLWHEARGGLRKLRRAHRTTAERLAARARLGEARNARRVLFLCHGNICRSAYAAARMEERTRSMRIEVRSAGTTAKDGSRPPEFFQRIAAARGIDLCAHSSRTVDVGSLTWADLVVIMDGANRNGLARLDPGVASRALMLGALDPQGGADVPDPYLLPAEEVSAVLESIDRSVEVLVAGLARGGSASPDSAAS